MWDDTKFIAFDFETTGDLPEYALQPWRVRQGKAWITSVSFARKLTDTISTEGGLNDTGYARFAARDRHDSIRMMLAAFLRDCIEKEITIVGWNVQFDIQWLMALGLEDLVFQCKWLDGMLLWRHWFIEPEYETDRSKKKSYGLKSCVAELLPRFADYAEDVDFHSEEPAERKKLQEYNDRDTVFTLYCTRHWYKKLSLNPQQLANALIEAESIPLIAQANLRGMLIDTLSARELSRHLVEVSDAKLKSLAPHGVTEKIVRSPIQMANLLYDVWRLPVLKENTGKKTGKTSRATDKEVLHELAFKDPRAKELREYREALNNRTKFAEAPLQSVAYCEDHHTHPNAIVFGTYSGRLTYASKQGKGVNARPIGFALHQEKRDAMFRNVVIAPQGYTIVEFDAAGQEFKWMAIASGDETMLKLCLPGEDAHSYMGSRIDRRWGYRSLMKTLEGSDDAAKATAKPVRQLGKVGNLSLQYRTSARKLRVVARVQYDIPMEEQQARVIHATYRLTYPGVEKYWSRQIALTKMLGYVETYAGRRVQVVGDWGGRDAWSMESTSINYRIQGTGADQKYLAMKVLRPYLRSIGAYFAWDLHDGIYLYVPDDKVKVAIQTIRTLLNNLPYQEAWGFTPPIPLTWDCKAGKSWGGLKEVKE
jgi:DNA polymerase I-like protein with 3'-5' exonuclease and polymerase domains